MPVSSSATVWPLGPSRHDRVNVELEYRTDIIRSSRGKESQRRVKRDRPRKTQTLPTSVQNACLQELLAILRMNNGKLFAIPDWTRREVMATAFANGGNSFTVASTPGWLVAGESIIVRDGSRSELYAVQSVSSGTVTLTATNGGDTWGAGTAFYLALEARFPRQVETSEVIRNTRKAAFEFDVEPGREFYAEPPAAPTTYNGRETFLTPPTIINARQTVNEHGRGGVDFDVGLKRHFINIPHGTEILAATWSKCTLAKIELLQDVFVRARGMAGEFYCPTWTQDMIPNTTAGSGTTTLEVAGEYIADYNGSTVWKALAIEFTDGTFELNTVNSIAAGSGVSTLTVATGWSKDIVPAEVSRCMWMPVRRFASDLFTVEWLINQRAGIVNLTMQTLEDL